MLQREKCFFICIGHSIIVQSNNTGENAEILTYARDKFRLMVAVAEGRKPSGSKAKMANRTYGAMTDRSLRKSTDTKGLSRTYYQHH